MIIKRQDRAGELDSSFGNGGIVISPFSTTQWSAANGVALQPDGKLLIAGVIGGEKFCLARLEKDGKPNTSFGSNGSVTDVFAANSQASASSVYVLADGKILLIGTSTDTTGTYPALARYDEHGALDISFGTNGKAVVPLPAGGSTRTSNRHGKSTDVSTDVAALDFAVGNVGDPLWVKNHYPSADGEYDLIARLKPNGTLDTSFGGKGYVPVKYLKYPTYINALQELPGGAILVGGNIEKDGDMQGLFAQYASDGRLDTLYGKDGYVVMQGSTSLSGIVKRSEVKIIGVGITGSPNQGLLVGIQPDGSPDPEFAKGGLVVTDFIPGETGWMMAKASRSYTNITVVGYTEGGEEADVLLARYLPNGSLDSSFGEDHGWVRSKVGSSIDMGAGLALQPDGKIVVCGTTFQDNGPTAFVMRYIG